MKKLNLLFGLFVAIILLSFTQIEINNEIANDPIVGTWELEKLQYNYPDGSVKEESFSKCYDKVRHTFNTDGTLNFIFPEIDDNTGNCSYNKKDFWTGTWKKIGDGKYKTFNVQKHPKSQKSTYTDSTEIYDFSNNGNTLKKLKNFKESGIIFESKNAPVSELATYKRIK